MLIDIRLANIKTDENYRGSSAELQKLAESIKRLGLLQPVVLNSEHKLIAGRRRIAACRELGMTHVSALVCATCDDVRKALAAERDENTCRLELTPTQKKEIADRIREAEKPEAENREKSGKNSDSRPCGNFPQGRAKTVDELAAEAAGTSDKTLRKIDEIVEAAEADPESFGDLPAKMDESGKVDPVHKELKQRRGSKKKRKPTTKGESLKDADGTEVPSLLRDLFGDSFLPDAAEAVEGAIGVVKRVQRNIEKKGGAYGAFFLSSKTIALLTDAADALDSSLANINEARPHVVCGKCGGTPDKKCGDCRNSGWLPKWRAKELKTGEA